MADANSGYARTRIQNANGDFNFFTNSDLSSGIPAVSIRSAPAGSRLLVQSQDGLNTVGYQPFLTLTDGNAGYRRGRMQSGNGDVLFYTETGIAAGVPNFSIKDVTGNVGIGTPNPSARLEVIGRTKTGTLEITGGSDLAEPFEAETAFEPGTIMSINPEHPGTLQQSIMAYDTRVAGIVSGAGDVRPGLTLRQDNVMTGNTLIAIAGRVYCKAEALSIPIQPGDLLTTSRLAGYAMKATDKERSRGAIIGKAMSTLKNGKGLVLVLVNLQ